MECISMGNAAVWYRIVWNWSTNALRGNREVIITTRTPFCKMTIKKTLWTLSKFRIKYIKLPGRWHLIARTFPLLHSCGWVLQLQSELSLPIHMKLYGYIVEFSGRSVIGTLCTDWWGKFPFSRQITSAIKSFVLLAQM